MDGPGTGEGVPVSRWRNRDVPIVGATVVGDELGGTLDAGRDRFPWSPTRELRARCRNLLQLRQQSESVKQRAVAGTAVGQHMHEVEEREG